MSGTTEPSTDPPSERQLEFPRIMPAQGKHAYARVPTVTWHLMDALELTDPERLLTLYYLGHRSRQTGTAWPGSKRTQDLLGWSRSKLQRTRRRLVEAGVLRVLRTGTGRASTIVALHPTIEAALTPARQGPRGVTHDAPGGSFDGLQGVHGRPPSTDEEQAAGAPAGAGAPPPEEPASAELSRPEFSEGIDAILTSLRARQGAS